VKLLLHKRGSVALLTAVMAPVLIMTLALGVEVSFWSLKKVELQRIADVAAWAGARQFIVTSSPQSATNTAADVAELNGATVTSPSARVWTAATSTTAPSTMTDNTITAQVILTGAGVKNTTDTVVKVTVTQNIAKSFSRIFSKTQSSVTVSAVAVAELATVGTQPCLLALGQAGVLTGADLTGVGNVTIDATDCSVRSNGDVNLSGTNVSLTADGIYAAGVINPGDASITGTQYQGQGQINDPYANYAPLVAGFNTLSSPTANFLPDPGKNGQTTGLCPPSTICPGSYSSITLDGNQAVTLQPGTYYVEGDVSFAGKGKLTGTGVTIIAGGTISYTGSGSDTLAAPLSGSTTGGIPGVLFASKSTATGGSQFAGKTSDSFSGVIYYPNGTMAFAGTSNTTTDGLTGCNEVVAKVIAISGSAKLFASCSASDGTLPFGSVLSVALVQ
jgi:Flp pilus assembly protein TadG